MYDSKACAFDHYIVLSLIVRSTLPKGKKQSFKRENSLKFIVVLFSFAFFEYLTYTLVCLNQSFGEGWEHMAEKISIYDRIKN